MTLTAGCPRCAGAVSADDDRWRCDAHGPITPLWRPDEAGYHALVEHLACAADMPTLVPWPLSPGWVVTDFGCVADEGTPARASFLSCSGPSDLDGVVEVSLVSEEPGVGLGARCARVHRTDPGADIGEGPPQVRLRVDGRPVSMWAVSTSDSDRDFDRSVFVGEALGRWLWLVLRPASAALLFGDEWVLTDMSTIGPALVGVPFGGHPPAW